MAKTALVWGAGGGIGRRLVQHLIQDGWQVLAVTHEHDELDGLTPYVYDADVANPHQVAAVIGALSQEVEAVDLWVYAAGDITSARVAEMTPDTWQQVLGANLNGAFVTTQASMHLLAPDAHLVYLGAVSERMRLPGLSAYAAAKAGLEAFLEALRKEERSRRITLLRPGAVDTPLWRKVPFKMPANALAADTVVQRVLDIYRDGEQGVVNM